MCIDYMFACHSFFRGVKQVDFKDIEKSVASLAKKNGSVQKNERDFLAMYHIKADEYEDLIYYGPSSYLDVNEITLIYAPGQPHVYDQVVTHIESQKKSFEGYGIEQTRLLSKAKVVQLKDYVICIVSEDEAVSQAVLDLFH